MGDQESWKTLPQIYYKKEIKMTSNFLYVAGIKAGFNSSDSL